ncbi:WG repeat-containing protein [Tenacibaculum ascidiaceicola]|uniref:WG repeat-containing protein n=1 Tax=Tenacibaculum ascidiaceicola TaxID=1699411 RepID=UPI0039ED0FCD
MKNKILLLAIIAIISSDSFSQEKIKPDIAIMNFLGRVPQKTPMNSAIDNLIKMLYYNPQPPKSLKIGFLDTKGKTVVKAKYNMASDFYGNYANVIRDSIYGYINNEGEEVLFKQYEEVYFYYENVGIAKKKGKYGLIDRKGDSLTRFEYTSIDNLGFNLFKAYAKKRPNLIMNAKGDIIFNKDSRFDIRSHYVTSDSLFIFQKDINGEKLQGLVSINGEIVCKAKYQDIYFINDKKFFVVKNKDKYGFIDKKGKEVIPLIYEKVSFNINNDLIAAMKKDKWGYINRKNKEVIPFVYDEAHAFLGGLALVRKGNLYGSINKRNKVKIDFKLEPTGYPFYTNNLKLYKEDGKYGFIDKKGKVKIKAKYDNAFPFINELAYVELNGKAGYINKEGKEIIPIKYKQLWFESDGLIRFAN